MAKKEQMKKEIKRLKKRAEKAEVCQQRAEKRLEELKKLIKREKKKLKRIRREEKPEVEASGEKTQSETVEVAAGGVARSQREAWRRHSFLRERYEAYLGMGEDKSDARALANQDLRKEFGKAIGFTPEQLHEILS